MTAIATHPAFVNPEIDEREHACLREFLFVYQMFQDELQRLTKERLARLLRMSDKPEQLSEELIDADKLAYENHLADAILHGDWAPFIDLVIQRHERWSGFGMQLNTFEKLNEQLLDQLEDRLVIYFDNHLEKALPAMRGIRIFQRIITDQLYAYQRHKERIAAIKRSGQAAQRMANPLEWVQQTANWFQAPLYRIQEQLHQLQEKEDTVEPEVMTKQIINEVSDLSTWVDHQVLFAQLGQLSSRTKVNLNELMREVIQQVSAEGYPLSKSMQIQAMPTAIDIYPAELGLMFRLLIKNMIQNRDPHKTFEASMQSARIAGGWQVELRDASTIVASQWYSMLNKFFLDQEEHRPELIAQGFPLMKKIMQLHQGKVRIEPLPYSGFLFSITIPDPR
ncbi:MAG TPA: hypothetical protein VFV37_05730 [Luteibaculaceae bacterium]|nr:hypothetical protein [Luteibaculaceae bacterium]